MADSWTIQGTITPVFRQYHIAISSLQQGSGGVGEARSKSKSKAKARLRLRLQAKANIDSHASPHGVGSADLSIYLSIYLSTYLSIYLSIIPIHMYIYIYVYLIYVIYVCKIFRYSVEGREDFNSRTQPVLTPKYSSHLLNENFKSCFSYSAIGH